MGKPKKANLDKDQEDFEEEGVTKDADKDDMKSENSTQPSKDSKKKNKKSRKKDDDWDDIESEMQGLTLEAKNGNDDEDSLPIVSQKSKNKKKPKKSAFALLAEMEGNDDDDDDDDDDGGDADELNAKKSDNEDGADNKEEIVTKQKSKKDKGKKEKAKKTQEEEDIDAMLADIESSGTEKKKKKKKNKGGDADPDEEEEPQVTETPLEDLEGKVVSIDDLDDEFEDDKKKKRKNKKKGKESEITEEKIEEEGDENEEEGTVLKTAAQKKKEKKEREKQKKMEEKQKQLKKEQAKKEKEVQEGDKAKDEETVKTKEPKEPNELKESKKTEETTAQPPATEAASSHEPTPEADAEEGEDGKEKESKKKKKKKGEKEKEEKKEEKVKPRNKQIAALKEALRIKQEEEEAARQEVERLRKEEEENIRKLEEELKEKEELKRLKKQQKKEREAQLKKEGKFLTEKQKQDQKRLEQMLAAMKLSGVEIGPRSGTEGTNKRMVYGKKKKFGGNKEKSPSTVTSPTEESPKPEAAEPVKTEQVKAPVKEEEDVKDEWDAESEEEEEPEEVKKDVKAETGKVKQKEEEEEEEDDDEEDDDDEEEDSSEESETESESEEGKTAIDRARDKIQKRADKAEKARTLDHLRAPVVCVLGHVDTGKTKILDKLRRTNVQDGEAGGITQQIGATNVPGDALIEKTKMVKEFAKQELKIPGLLIIDTPGHESFSNLRLRGSSLCDIAILVIDIMHGLEPQTLESIKLLKERKTPFLVALNKIDRLYQWKPQPMADVQNTLKKQTPGTKAEFDERAQHVKLQLAEEGLNAAIFYENKNPREYVSLVPTSAHTGDGMGNLVALVCELCQSMLAKRLMYSTELQATVMEVKSITGMGTTIDVILINGSLNEGDTVVLAGTEGPIITQIRGLLMPQPMKELRVKNQYEHHKTVMAAQGVKINAKEMEKCLAGLPLYVAHDNDEREYYRAEVKEVLSDTLESIKVQDRGVFVQASTLGSLEALLDFLRTSKIPYAGINIGPVHKKDIMRASVMLEHESQYAVILAFDVKVEREAQELADNLGVRIFTAEIIYHLFDAFTKYREDLKRQKQEEFKFIAVFPCKLRILPQFVFNSRDPIVMGVVVEAGFLKEGTPICVPSKEFVDIGRVSSLELNHKNVDIARQGQEVCIKIVPNPGEAPKMFGRHFEETDTLVSKISRESIDAVKDYFREEMTKPDWRLMVDLKKQFEIL